MDSLITAAAQALAAGDALGALKRVALRDDAPALALRGIAMAQLGDLARARVLVRRAARAFGARAPRARARCIVAEAEIALAARDLDWPAAALENARAILDAHGDPANRAHVDCLSLRRLLLIGQLDEAERRLAAFDPAPLMPPSRAAYELVVAGLALRRLRTAAARQALDTAARAAERAGIPALRAEVEQVRRSLEAPAARLIAGGTQQLLRLDEVETVFASNRLVVDACRGDVRDAQTCVSLARRPVLFTLVRALAEAWPADVDRDTLVARAFRGRSADESHRARLRVEIGRLRRALRAQADIRATARGFVLVPRDEAEPVVLAQPTDEAHAAVLALLADGESWSSSALALALGASQRTAQRALDALAAGGKVRALGHGRARRWLVPALPAFATILLLPAPLGGD